MIMLVVSWHFSAAAMCEYSRQEFLRGMAGLGCDSTDALRRMLPRLRAELQDAAKFKARVLQRLLAPFRFLCHCLGLFSLLSGACRCTFARAGRGCGNKHNKGETAGDISTFR